MGSKTAESAKRQTWPRDERNRQLSFVKGAIQMLRNGKSGAAVRFLRDNNVTMVFPHERPPEPEGLRVLRELNSAAEFTMQREDEEQVAIEIEKNGMQDPNAEATR